MKTAPTLIDALYRATFRNEPILGFKDNADLRQRLVAAGRNRFMLSDEMSEFLGELATRAFVPIKGNAPHQAKLMQRQVEAMRVSARSPHKIIWIEYNLRAAAARTQGLLGRTFDPANTAMREGWLIEQHPQNDAALRMHLFTLNPPEEADEHGFSLWGFPFIYTWTVNAEQSPWPSIVPKLTRQPQPDSAISSGILTYDSPSVTIAQSDLQESIDRLQPAYVVNLIREWVGITRRAWALLATLNDLPLVYAEVRAAKGFVARGRYRRFLDHRTITINVPKKDQTKLARNLIALVRRRAHQVRGHWRDDWRNPPSARCDHLWTVEQRCDRCGGHRLWIHEHQRGDASLGLVTHDYNVTHEVQDG